MRLRTIAAPLLVIACTLPSSTTTNAETVPDRASFPPVADLLERRCGTLDCHGSAYRNMRVYGSLGLRLAPSDRPLSKGQTTAQEYDAAFYSIIALEPELTSAVVSSGGASPERLTFVRKARGAEQHKGGTLMRPGDPEDTCVTSWLSGHTDVAVCASATTSAF